MSPLREAHADGPVPLSRSLRGDALAEYEGGKALFKGGDFAGALSRFHRAADLSSDPRLLWDMAACEQKLGHIARMATLIDRYLANGGGLLTDADRRLATRLETSVRGRMSAVTVTSNPDGADVYVDDELVGKTPIDQEPVWVEAGSHRVAFKKAGWKDGVATQEVTGGGESAWTMTLEREPKPPPAPAAEPPKPVPLPPPQGEGTKKPPSRVPPLILVGAGAVQLVAGGVLVGLAELKFSQLRHDCSPACNPSSASPWPTLETVGDVLLATGAVTAAAGVVWWITLRGPSDKSSALWIAPAPGGAALGGTL